MPSLIEKRKREHIELCLRENVEYENISSGFDDINLIPGEPVPISETDTSCALFGRKLASPIEIEAMTGGYAGAAKINKKLAKAAQEKGTIFCLGSQRAMIEKKELAYTYKVRDVAPDILLFGNIGYAQLKELETSQMDDALKEVDADALYIHINPIQENLQEEGDTANVENFLGEMGRVASELSFPVAVKETGAGISGALAEEIRKAGIGVINVAGAGGTAWGRIELLRSGKKEDYEKEAIPTVVSLLECSQVEGVTLITSGGVRGGSHVAKSIALGSDFAGAALPFLKAENPEKEVEKWVGELKTSMSLIGAHSIEELKKINAEASGKTAKTLKKKGFESKRIKLVV